MKRRSSEQPTNRELKEIPEDLMEKVRGGGEGDAIANKWEENFKAAAAATDVINGTVI